MIDREAYKTQIRNFLTANAPDVATWYAANRMRPYVEAGLFEDVSDLWAEPAIADNLASTKGAMTIDGKQWGVPYTYYQWGVYYRKDIFDELGLSEPTTWEEEKANCQKIIDAGKKCYTIGTKFLWTAGGWFDYLNMRTNGFDFHMDLLTGKASWKSDEVRKTFANWRELIDMGAFIDNHQTYSWQEALPFMVKGDAAAYLMGNFAVAPLREAGLSGTEIAHERNDGSRGRTKTQEIPQSLGVLIGGANHIPHVAFLSEPLALSCPNSRRTDDQSVQFVCDLDLAQIPAACDVASPEVR